MVRDERAEVDSTWAHEECETRREGHVDKRHGVRNPGGNAAGARATPEENAKALDPHGERRRESAAEKHREIDHELRRIAKERAGLDAQEARWLREAERHQIWRALGFSTALEYLEDVFGYAPRTAMERLRLAKDLGELPQLEAELMSGALPYSAAKELSRVPVARTCATSRRWGRRKGDSPDAPADPELVVHEVRLSLTARSKALWEQMRGVLEMECDGHLDDDQLVEVVARRVLGGDSSPSEKPPRPAHRIVVHKCDECARAWQETRGRWIELPPADLDLAECDAMIVNENQQPVTSAEAKASATDKHHTRAAGTRSEAPERVTTNAARATSDIPEKTRKRVWTRDRGRCCVPGCRATRHIDFHHLLARALGGTHDESNIALLCSGHHKLLHQGILSITGPAPDGLVFMRDGKRLVDPRAGGVVAPIDAPPSTARNRFADVAKHEHAKQALRQLGMSAPAARAALEEASAHMDANAGVAQLVQVAFERSRRQVTESATREAVGDEAMKLATQALIQLGYPSAVATSAVNAARAHVGTGDLTTLIKEALQRTSS